MSFLDLIFPRKCISCRKFGDFICANCFSKIKYCEIFICPHCFRPSAENGLTHPYCLKPLGIDGVISAVVYQGVAKRLLAQFKYDPHLHKLDKTMGELMCEDLSQNESFYNFLRLNPILIPIPLSPKRQRARGYNHAELLGSYVAQYFSLKINTKLLVRVKDTKPQYKLGRKERFENIRDAFDIIGKKSPVPEAIILVDDLATTFSTLKEATKILKRAGAKKVIGITFAREL